MRTGLVIIALIGLTTWRQIEWRTTTPPQKLEETVQGMAMLWQEPNTTYSNISIPYHAWKLRCYRKLPTCLPWEKLQAGDTIYFEGVWQQAESETWYIAVKQSEVEKTNGLWWRGLRWIQKITTTFVNTYRLFLSEPYSSLLTGIVWGKQGEFPDDFYDALITSGTVHVVAASGYNVAVVSGTAMTLLLLIVSRKVAWIGGVVGVLLYVLMAGMSPPIIRAGLMGMLVLLAQGWGRLYRVNVGLVVVISAMLIMAPWMIVSVSFQLSVAATMGVIYGTQPMLRLLTRQKCPIFTIVSDAIFSLLATTLAAIFATLPLIALHFQRVSLIAPLANVLVLGVVPPIMGLGMIMALMGWWLWSVQFMTWIVYPLLWWFVTVVELTARIPMAP